MKDRYPFILFILALLGIIILLLMFIPGGTGDLLDEDPDEDGYSGQFSRPGDEEYTTREENENDTHPYVPDTDGDGMLDGWEVRWGFNPNDPSDAAIDTDGDGFSNLQEYENDTNPKDMDLDHDGMPDVWEILHGLDPENPDDRLFDPDNDGLTNLEEFLFSTDPNDPDSDDDLIPDGWEANNDLDPNNINDGARDSDSGGVTNHGEYVNDTDPWDPTDDYGNSGGGNGGSGIPTGNGIPPDTGRTDNTVTLINVFDPPLGRLKRWQVLDGLSSRYLMYLTNETLHDLELSTGDYEYIFYGALNVTLSEGIAFRIPSPSPDSVLLGYYLEDASLSFYKDSVDNYYVVSNNDASGTLSFTFGTDGAYYSLDIPEVLTIQDEPSFLLPSISSNVQESVSWFLENTDDPGVQNLDGETSVRRIVTNLTAYFSSFTAGNGDVPEPTLDQDIYQAIAINKIGACRHRSFAFFVTANALGIPTRYVSNEVHAFVEVYIPDGGYSSSNWHRIDLGGTGTIQDGEPRPPTPDEGNVTIIHLDPVPADLFMGVQFTITGSIENETGIALPYHPFTVFIGDIKVENGSSDSNGNIDLDITLMNIALGWNNISLRALPYNGFASSISGNRTFEFYSDVLFHPFHPDSTGQNTDLYCGGFVSSVNGTGLPGESVSFFLDDISRDTEISSDSGEYNLSYFIPGSMSTGVHELALRYQAQGYLLDSFYNTSVLVKSQKVVIQASVLPAKQDAGLLVNVIGSIADGSDNSISGRGRLIVALHGMVYKNDTLVNFTGPGGKDFNISLLIPVTLSRGNYTLYVAFDPNEGDSLPGASRNIDLEVDKVSTFIYLHPGSSNIQDDLVINGTLYSGSGISVPGNVSLYWNGHFMHNVPVDANGDFRYTDTTPGPPGLGVVTAYYLGSEMFSSSQASVNYSMYSTTYLTVDADPQEGVIYRNITISLPGNLNDYDDENVEGMVISLYVNGNLHDQVVSDDGGYFLSFFLSPDYDPAIALEIGIEFHETGYYRGTTLTMDYQVHALTTVEIINITEPVRAGTNITLIGQFYDDMGHLMDFPLNINFLDQNFTPYLENGTFSWNYLIPLGQESGLFPLLVEFDGWINFEASSDEFLVTIYHKTNITVIPYNLTRGTTGRFEGSIRDEQGQGIPALPLDIYLRGDYIGSTVSVVSGQFLVHLQIMEDIPLGPANITVIYNGSVLYSPSNYNYTINIYAQTSILLQEDDYVFRDDLVLAGRLVDNLLDPLGSREIILTFNKEDIYVFTDENGSFEQRYDEDIDLGHNLLTARFPGDGFYLTSESSIDIYLVSNLTITIDNFIEPVAGNDFVVAGSVTDDRDDFVTTNLNFTLTSIHGNVSKNRLANKGFFNNTWALPADMIPGDYTLFINNSSPYPSSHFLHSSLSMDVHLLRATYIEMIIPEATRGEMVHLEGSLRDARDQPVTYAALTLMIDLEEFPLLTDGYGNFSYDFLAPPDMAPGPHPLMCIYEGNNSFLEFTYVNDIYIYVNTHIDMSGKRSHWSAINISGQVRDNLGNPVAGYIDVYFDNTRVKRDYPVFYDTFRIDHIHHDVGEFLAFIEFAPPKYYHASNASALYTVFSFYTIEYIIESPITDSLPVEIHLENAVLADSQFNFSMVVASDIGIEPEIHFTLEFNNTPAKQAYSNTLETWFHVNAVLKPQDEHYLTIRDNTNNIFFQLYPDPTLIRVNVVQPTGLSVSVAQAVGNLYLNGTVKDSNHRIVSTGEIGGTRQTIPLELDFNSGYFRYSNDSSMNMGWENFFFEYYTNRYYFYSSEEISIFIKGITVLKLSVPKDLEYGEEFQGSVQLTLKNGDPIPSAVLTLQMGDDYMTVITDKDGKKKFTGVMDSNESITLTASFSGSSQYYPSYDEKKISFKEEQDPFLTASDLFTTNALIIYLLLGGCGFYIWRRKQIHYLMSIVHDTALRLDSGENPKQVIIIAYNLMCRHLRRFNLLRRRDETVSEFKDQVMENLKLSDDGVGNLTSLFEYADYSSSETTEHHKDNAVHGLRNVEKELAGVSTRGRRK